MSTFALLAQAAEAARPDDIPQGVFVFLSILASAGISITVISLGFKHAAQQRELQHAERMKALERGLLLDDVEEDRRIRKGLMRLATGLGIVVPICAIGAATGAVTGMGSGTTSMSVFLIWTGAASVGVAGVACGAWLAQATAARFSPRRREELAPSPYPRSYAETAAAN